MMVPFVRMEMVDCGKNVCKKCCNGPGHGPYAYEYSRDVKGKLRKKYIGKKPVNAMGYIDFEAAILAGMPTPTWALCLCVGCSQRDTFSEMRECYRRSLKELHKSTSDKKEQLIRTLKAAWKQLRGERR